MAEAFHAPPPAAHAAPEQHRAASPALEQRLAAMQARYPASDPAMVAEIVRAVLSSMRGDLGAQEASLLAEVEELGHTIARARAEIAALRVDDITASHIPSATDELGAIVHHTAAATHAILEACETLDTVGDALAGEPARAMQEATTRIYEACSFQDITGQRIAKVVTTLTAIEHKVAQIVAAFSSGAGQDQAASAGDGLLNGPQLPENAMDQSDIDRLLASFE